MKDNAILNIAKEVVKVEIDSLKKLHLNIGKSLIRKFTKNNYRVIAVTRSIHRKGYQIKTQSNYGYLELE